MIKERATIVVPTCKCLEGKGDQERIAAAFPREREREIGAARSWEKEREVC